MVYHLETYLEHGLVPLTVPLTESQMGGRWEYQKVQKMEFRLERCLVPLMVALMGSQMAIRWECPKVQKMGFYWE